jgi:hypothetical protein
MGALGVKTYDYVIVGACAARALGRNVVWGEVDAYWPSLLGGMQIGLSATMLLLLNGRIAGVSGIVGSLPSR